jgi:HAD superfamily hydrolase (TIGR01450 family)
MYIVVDLDGTVYLGDEAIARSVEALDLLAEHGHRCVFVTNNSLAPASAYVAKLAGLGVSLAPAQVLTANEALSSRLRDVFGTGAAVYAVGADALTAELTSVGLRLVDDHRIADVVALGWDREFTYAKLDAICAARWAGTPVYATNPDPTCPMVDGEVPDCGALIAAIETATGSPIDEVVGKPSVRMVELALARYGGKIEDCWVVGDRLHTDVQMAVDSKARSALVLTGASTRSAVEVATLKPTMVCEDLYEFATAVIDGQYHRRTSSAAIE